MMLRYMQSISSHCTATPLALNATCLVNSQGVRRQHHARISGPFAGILGFEETK